MTEGTPKESLLDAGFLKRLDRLALAAKHAVVGGALAERKSRRRGISIEFADYRPYTAGDDFRYIDWNMYGRLQRLYTKLFVAEEDLDVRVYVDRSASMDFGDPRKLFFASQIGAAIAYLGLRLGDRVAVQSFNTRADTSLEPSRGRARIWRVFEYLQGLEPGGETHFENSFKRPASIRRGAAFVVSDFLSPHGYEDGLRALAAVNSQVSILHVVTPEEIEPDHVGDLSLVDRETSNVVDITATARVRQIYHDTFDAHTAALSAFAHKYGMTYTLAITSTPLEELIFKSLRISGVIG